MTTDADRSVFAGPGIMLISALIFGYFGFGTNWVHQSAMTGQVVPFVPILEWTLQGTAIAFGVAAVLTFTHAAAGNVLYAVAGLLSAIAFVVVAVMDLLDPVHTAISPLLLLIFAVWNGFGSWSTLRWLLSPRRR